MPSPSNPRPARSGRGSGGKSAEPTAALFVRIPTEYARRLDRAAFELRVPKQSLVSELVERYVNPDSPASLVALGKGWGKRADGTARTEVHEPRVAADERSGDIADGPSGDVADRPSGDVADRSSGDAVGRGPRGSVIADPGGSGRRRVTVETLDPGDLTIGRHSFRPRNLEVLTPEDAAELLQVDPDVVLDLARAGTLPGRELGGEWRFARAALLEWLGAGIAEGTAHADAKG
jgi:excisionase family DNA binding protein